MSTYADEYQRAAARTLIDGPDAEYTGAEIMLVWNAIGLAGEAGEVADTVKGVLVMNAGRELDALIVEKVYGWQTGVYRDLFGDTLYIVDQTATRAGEHSTIASLLGEIGRAHV